MARRNVDKEIREEVRSGGRGQTFYSGISNGAAKSPCNFLSAGESNRERGKRVRESIYTAFFCMAT